MFAQKEDCFDYFLYLRHTKRWVEDIEYVQYQ